MIAPGADLKIHMATPPVDFRRGLDGLAAAVQEMLASTPTAGPPFSSGPKGLTMELRAGTIGPARCILFRV